MEDGCGEEVLLVGGRVLPGAGAPAADAILVRGGLVGAVGEEADVRQQASRGAREVDVGGATLTAGFVDAHTHLTMWGLGLRQISLSGAASVEIAAERVAEAAREVDGWLLGHGWNRHLWTRLPDRTDLDRLIPDRPVFLDSQDLHAAWLNSTALRLCGITRDTPDPPGGQIVRELETGEATGLLLENARALARFRLPEPTADEICAALGQAQKVAHGFGVTGVHSLDPTGLRDFTLLAERGELELRVLQHIQLNQLGSAVRVGLRSGFGGGLIRIGGVKMFLDGTLGSRTAWLREPYEETPSEFGIATLLEREFREAVQEAAAHGLASTVHAIGDSAVGLALDVLGEIAPPATMPHRIEHLQLCPPEWWARVASAEVTASMQPAHLLSDVQPAERDWGARAVGAFAFAELLRAGACLAFGSDVPVETLDPRAGLYAATARGQWAEFEDGRLPAAPWYGRHLLTGAEAVAAYTEGPARAAGTAHLTGRLHTGFAADVTVWSHDPTTLPPERYRDLECLMTIVAGRIVHDRIPIASEG